MKVTVPCLAQGMSWVRSLTVPLTTQFQTKELTSNRIWTNIMPVRAGSKCVSVTPNGERLISVPPTITCDCDLRHNPTALHHSLVLGNNASDTGSVPLHHFFGEDCRVTAVGRLTQNRVCSGSIPVLYASSIQMN